MDALEHDNFLTAKMAKQFGLVDEVIDRHPAQPSVMRLELSEIPCRVTLAGFSLGRG